MTINENIFTKYIFIIIGPIISLIAFVITYYLDPLNFSNQQPYSALPAFLVSIVILIINHNINTSYELKKVNQYSDHIYDAVKDYLHVMTLGSPEKALSYVISRLPILREVKNTSFNLFDHLERADEKFYDTELYKDSLNQIAYYSCKKLIWKDIGDSFSLNRVRKINTLATSMAKGKKNHYKYRLISHNEPQLNFIILEYEDCSREVLFNWDFRGIGQDPTVLISRDKQILDMFTIHYSLLWKSSSIDHDNNAIRSTEIK